MINKILVGIICLGVIYHVLLFLAAMQMPIAPEDGEVWISLTILIFIPIIILVIRYFIS